MRKSYPIMLIMYFGALVMGSINVHRAEYAWAVWFLGIALLTGIWIGAELVEENRRG